MPMTSTSALGQLAVCVGQFTARGQHAVNQDAHAFVVPDVGLLTSKGVALALADGISSSAVSHVASQVAVRSVLEDYFSTPQTWSVKKSAERVMSATNGWLYAQSRNSGHTGVHRDRGHVCTLTVLILKSATAHILHIGDARVYLVRQGHAEQLTRDHQSGGFLSRAMGIAPQLELDYQSHAAAAGDVFVLMTDGAHAHLTPADIASAVASHPEADALAQHLVDCAQANGSQDDCTAQVLQVSELPVAQRDEALVQAGQLPCPPLLSVGDRLDGYTVLQTLHASSRSHVYLAQHDSGERVALKIPSLDGRHDPVYLERLMLEEWLLRRVHSEHVLRAPAPHAKTALYTVSEHLDGITLTQWMRANARPTLEAARTLIDQVARGLQALHRLDIVHRDLRPDNVMINAQGRIVLIDLGSAEAPGMQEWLVGSGDSALGTTTLAYSAPEMFLGANASAQSDQYALAAMLYQMLSGQMPYGLNLARARTRGEQLKLPYPPLAEQQLGLPVWLDSCLARALHPDPEHRYETLSEFTSALRVPPETLAVQSSGLLRRNPHLFWQCLCTLLLGVVMVQLWMLLAR